MATSAAHIDPETATAQLTEYDPAVLITEIAPHPKNIRHNAVADDEMVTSIREQGLLQPLVVMLYADTSIDPDSVPGDTRYILIAGHRRLDGLKKAGYTHAPAVIRYDLPDEADQVAAMLVENGRREDLNPIEEAEGFDLLTELGWDADRIAAASGRSKTLIKERRKLTALPEKAKAAVEDRQVTIDDALRIAKLPAAEQTRLEKYIHNHDFRFEIARTESRIRDQRVVDTEAKRLRDAGVPQLKPKTVPNNTYYLTHAEHGMVRLSATGKPDASDHVGCLAFLIGGTKQYPAIYEGCTDPGKHDAELNTEQLQRKQEQEAEQAAQAAAAAELARARQERDEAARVASQLRADTILAGIKLKPSQLDPALQALIALGVPELVTGIDYLDRERFQELAGIPAEQRWPDWIDRDDADDLGVEWALRFYEETGTSATKVLAALLVTLIEQQLGSYAPDALSGALASRYLAALEQAGHERNSVDEQLLAKHTQTEDGDQ